MFGNRHCIQRLITDTTLFAYSPFQIRELITAQHEEAYMRAVLKLTRYPFTTRVIDMAVAYV